MAVPYLRRYNLPCARGERERERERETGISWLAEMITLFSKAEMETEKQILHGSVYVCTEERVRATRCVLPHQAEKTKRGRSV